MYHQQTADLEIKQVCTYLLGKIDNKLCNQIVINDYHMCISRDKSNGALIINFNIEKKQ